MRHFISKFQKSIDNDKFQFNDYLELLNDILGGFKIKRLQQGGFIIKRFIEIVLIVEYLAIKIVNLDTVMVSSFLNLINFSKI